MARIPAVPAAAEQGKARIQTGDNLRHPQFYWVLAFYYPQNTTSDMGPTGLLPGYQAYKTVSDPDPQKTEEKPLALCGPAGTVALVHFDAWHRATENTSNKNRYMLKFQVARMSEPTASGSRV